LTHARRVGDFGEIEGRMSIKIRYGGSFREQLKHFPVWDVGSALSLGDYGIVSDNCFSKLGSLSDFDVTPEVDGSTEAARYYEFTSKGTTVADPGVHAAAGGTKGSLEVHFESAFSLFVRADQSRVVSMANVQRVATQLKQAVGWKRREFCWVSSVRVAKSLVLLMNTSASSSIRLQGDPGELVKLAAGQVSGSASASFKVTGDAGLRSFGGGGAVYVDLMRIGALGGTKPMRGDEESAVPVSPEEDIQKVDSP
jgi:hypothetical protein